MIAVLLVSAALTLWWTRSLIGTSQVANMQGSILESVEIGAGTTIVTASHVKKGLWKCHRFAHALNGGAT